MSGAGRAVSPDTHITVSDGELASEKAVHDQGHQIQTIFFKTNKTAQV